MAYWEIMTPSACSRVWKRWVFECCSMKSETIERNHQRIYLAGIDDAHFYRADNIEKAATGIPSNEFSILLSHTPEIYRQAALADFNILLSGHTHGGQICFPGRIPITLHSVLPRYMGSGPWKYRGMIGYTSVGAGSSLVPVRFNCPPEITLHRLRPPGGAGAAFFAFYFKQILATKSHPFHLEMIRCLESQSAARGHHRMSAH